jgi:aspartyl-tRNA(Asn)/glutamyl-tRNA(Gln) amidotransferase subunit A
LVAMGPLVRTVADAELMLDVLAGADPADRHSVELAPDPGDGPIRVAVSEDLGFAPVDPDVRAAFLAAIDALAAAGVDIVTTHPGVGPSAREWATIATAEARWSNPEARERLAPAVRGYLDFGETITAEAYVRAQFRREEIYAAYADLFARTGASALFTPTVGCVAFDATLPYPPQIGGVAVAEPWRDWAPFLYDANLAGLPACSVPIGTGALGLPVGGQLLGPRRMDRTVLRVATLLQDAVAASPTTD